MDLRLNLNHFNHQLHNQRNFFFFFLQSLQNMMDALHLHDCIHGQCAKQRLAVTYMDINSFPEREKEERPCKSFSIR